MWSGLCSVVVWALWGWAAAPEEAIPRPMISRLQRGHYTIVAEYAAARLLKDPHDAENLALLGAVNAAQGRYSEALDLFEMGDGSAFYEMYGIRYHADALRGVGDGRGAAALRMQRGLLKEYLTDWEHYDLLYRMDDLRSVGEFALALEVGLEAVSIAPDRPAYYAAIADIYIDMGDLSSAEEWLWLAERQPRRAAVSEVLVVEARLLLAQGYPMSAVGVLLPHIRSNMSNVEFWSVLGEGRRQSGSLEQAETIAGLKRFAENRAPALTALRARVLRDRGDTVGARGMILDALVEHPGNPTLRGVAAELGVL